MIKHFIMVSVLILLYVVCIYGFKKLINKMEKAETEALEKEERQENKKGDV